MNKKFRMHVPVTIAADDTADVFNARLKLEKAISQLVSEMNKTKGSAVVTANFSNRIM